MDVLEFTRQLAEEIGRPLRQCRATPFSDDRGYRIVLELHGKVQHLRANRRRFDDPLRGVLAQQHKGTPREEAWWSLWLDPEAEYDKGGAIGASPGFKVDPTLLATAPPPWQEEIDIDWSGDPDLVMQRLADGAANLGMESQFLREGDNTFVFRVAGKPAHQEAAMVNLAALAAARKVQIDPLTLGGDFRSWRMRFEDEAA